MTIQFRNGTSEAPGRDVSRLAAELHGVQSVRDLAERLKIDLRDFQTERDYVKEGEIWPLLRVAFQANETSRVLAHKLPVVSYPLFADVDLERPPLGFDEPIPDIALTNRPTVIGGFAVDFPIGVPASMIAGNAKFLEHYARRGFDILTYKTVRSNTHAAHPLPQWIFLEDSSEQLNLDELKKAVREKIGAYAEGLRWFTGRPGNFPAYPTKSSMANSFGVPSLAPQGARGWMADVASTRTFIRNGRKVLIVSVMATVRKGDNAETTKRDFVRTAELAVEAGANIVELNFSCPNTLERSGDIYNFPDEAKEIAAAVKQAVKAPVFIKIGYLHEEKLRALLNATSSAIDGVVAINTISARILDPMRIETTSVFPGRATAGVSGWAIQNAAQEVAQSLVKIRNELGRRDSLTLVSVGGVMNSIDFWSRLNTGVDAVESCTGAFLDPFLALKVRARTESDRLVKSRGSIEMESSHVAKPVTGSAPALSEDGSVDSASPVDGDHMKKVNAKTNGIEKRAPSESFAGPPPSLDERVNAKKFFEFVDANVKTTADVKALLKRRNENYEAAWARYKRSVQEKK